MDHSLSSPLLAASPHPIQNRDDNFQRSCSESQTHITSSTISVHLFLQDRRFSPSRRLAVDLEVPITAVSKDSHDRVHILVADLFSKLQSSFARIQGAYLYTQPFGRVNINWWFTTAPAIISTPHYLDPSYGQRFAEWTNGQLTDAVFDPSTLRLSADHRLTIFLDKVRLFLCNVI